MEIGPRIKLTFCRMFEIHKRFKTDAEISMDRAVPLSKYVSNDDNRLLIQGAKEEEIIKWYIDSPSEDSRTGRYGCYILPEMLVLY